MRFQVLGPVVALGPAGAADLGGPLQRRLLAVLLARAGTTVSTDVLVDALWGDAAEQPANPSAALQNQVSRLRRALAAAGGGADAAGVLSTEPTGYRLVVGADRLDAGRFEALAAEADAALDRGEPEAAVERCREALRLWSGRPYDEMADVEVLQPEVLRLDDLHLAVRERLGRALVAAGRPAEAVADLEVLAAEHPLHEAPLAALMGALAAAGRQPDALAQYQAFRRRLGDELGLEPSASLQRLEGRILRDEVQEPAAPAAGAAGSGLDRLAVRFVPRVDGPPLAVGEVGDGPPLVMGPAWVSSLDVIARGQDPRSSVLERLTPGYRLTLYDRLGTGLTGGEVTGPSLDASVRELEVVLDDLGGPVPVLAFSQGGPVAISLAVRRPDLVSAIVFFGSYADGPALFTNPELQESVTALMEAHWGLGSRTLADLFRPGASDQAAAHLSRVLRDSASGTVAATYLREVYEADVADLLHQVQVPCLVLHYRGDKVIPFGGAEQLVRGIPGARLIPLDGDVHVPDAHDLDRITQLITEHLALVGPPA